MDNPTDRKKKNEEFIKSIGCLINKNLPPIEDASELNFRSPIEVARRCCILSGFVASIGCKHPAKSTISWLKEENLWDFVSPEEKSMFSKANSFFARFRINKEAIAKVQWRVEALWALSWCIKKVKEISPLRPCANNLVHLIPKPPDESTKQFIETAELRDFDEILDQSDLIYRLHWATKEAMIRSKKNPVPLEYSEFIYAQRHHALNWVIGLDNLDWDDVNTDT